MDPIFVPSACGINQTRVYNDPTSRAAKKAAKGPNIFAGQSQYSRINTLKNCITQVNNSERAFNQVKRRTIRIRDTITTQTTALINVANQQEPAYKQVYRLPVQPAVQIIAFDPQGNLYSLATVANGLNLTMFARANLSAPMVGPTFAINQGTLITANLFWRNSVLVFVGVFYTTRTITQVFTFDANLVASSRLSIPHPGTKRYTGQSTYNSSDYIYVVLCPPIEYGFELALIYYIAPNWTYIQTSMLASYISIQQMIGDTRAAIVTSYSQNNLNITYLSAATVSWRVSLGKPGPCAITTVNNNIFVFYGDVSGFYTRLFPYTATKAPTLPPANKVNISWPFSTQYDVETITLSSTNSRLFYTLYLNNPSIINFEYYIQNGELDTSGNILWYSNIQIGSTYNVIRPNIQSSADIIAIGSGEEIITYSTTVQTQIIGIIDVSTNRDFLHTYIVYPGCECPKVKVNNIKTPLDGLSRTLQIATCEPQTFTNPTAVVDCGPVYTPSTIFLTPAQGAEPPQGPAISTVTRNYTNISGIDQICKPIPKRFSSSWTARLRASIQSATDTRYVNTVLPVVSYPFLCPVYGNQAGNPVASLCRPTIDGRPTTNI